MSNKKILIITRDFPPYAGRGGVMRILKFARYLPDFGWQPFIIAEKKDEIEDSTLLNQLPPEVEIEFVYSKTPQKRKNEYKKKLKSEPNLSIKKKIKYLFYRSIGYNIYALYQNYLMAPDLGLFWAADALKKAIDLHQQHKFDAFMTSGPPFSTFKIGIELKERIGIPWVLDFRDGWVGNPIYDAAKKKIINLQNSKLEKKAVEKASLSVFATDPMRKIYEERYPKQRQNMITITNGFDSEDHIGIQARERDNEKLHFVYSGTISGRQEPTSFFRGLINAINENKEIGQHLKITFIGKFNYHYPELLDKVKDFIDTPGVLPHRTALEKMGEADIFLLLINPSGGKTMMTTKIFEYIAFKKPIFAVSIPCAATDLIRENDAGYIAAFSDEDEIKKQIVQIFDDWRLHKLISAKQIENIDRFERKNLTKELSMKINKLITDAD